MQYEFYFDQEDGSVFVKNNQQSQFIKLEEKHQYQVLQYKQSPCQRFVASFDIKKTIYIWDLLEMKLHNKLNNTIAGYIDSIQWSFDSKFIAVAGRNNGINGTVAVFDIYDKMIDLPVAEPICERFISSSQFQPILLQWDQPQFLINNIRFVFGQTILYNQVQDNYQHIVQLDPFEINLIDKKFGVIKKTFGYFKGICKNIYIEGQEFSKQLIVADICDENQFEPDLIIKWLLANSRIQTIDRINHKKQIITNILTDINNDFDYDLQNYPLQSLESLQFMQPNLIVPFGLYQ